MTAEIWTYPEGRAVPDLALKAVHFDVDRILRPTLPDRWQDRRVPSEPAAPEDAPFAYDITLAISNTPDQIVRKSAEVRTDVERMRDGLTRQITTPRGCRPHRLMAWLEERGGAVS